jgi:ATP-dependent DNA helicase DinG
LAVEAGTGVGKSFAYLIPTIEMVCRTGSKALISTYTITLQEQLINASLT